MDAGCCRLLLLTNTLPHVQGAEYFYACAQVSLEVRLKCCQPQLAVVVACYPKLAKSFPKHFKIMLRLP